MGEWISSNRYLTWDEMKHNAIVFRDKATSLGFTLNAICGMLGNATRESNINPGIWQGLKSGNLKGGYGLFQETPASKYVEWAGADWENNGDKQLDFLYYQMKEGLGYYPTKAYPLSALEFRTSTESPEYLASAFMKNYERPGKPYEEQRREYARFWWDFLK